ARRAPCESPRPPPPPLAPPLAEDEDDVPRQHDGASEPDLLDPRALPEDQPADDEGQQNLDLLHSLDVRAHGHRVGRRAELRRQRGERAETQETEPVPSELTEVAGPAAGRTKPAPDCT